METMLTAKQGMVLGALIVKARSRPSGNPFATPAWLGGYDLNACIRSVDDLARAYSTRPIAEFPEGVPKEAWKQAEEVLQQIRHEISTW